MAMQVVYSAGTTSPTGLPPRSPRMSPRVAAGSKSHSPKMTPRSIARASEGWQPVMPGYKPPHAEHRRSLSKSSSQQSVSGSRVDSHHEITDSNLKASIPGLSRPAAITCLVLNCIIPGSGTFVSGLTVLCGSRVRPGGIDKANVIWVNAWLGLLQFLTTFLFLIGWIWSIAWATTFLKIARAEEARNAEAYKASPEQKESAANETTAMTRDSEIRPRTQSLPGNGVYNGNDRPAPIIVLQEAPVILTSSGSTSQLGNERPGSGQRTLNPNNRYHLRLLRQQRARQASTSVPDLVLSPGSLEQIVLSGD